MNNLEKELVKSSEKQQARLASEAKLLLATNEQKELDTLKAIGLSAEILHKEEILEDLLIRERHQERFKAQVVHKKDIQKLLLRYRLYMKGTTSYRGRIPPTLGAELTRFCEEKNIVLSGNPAVNRFYIIAPPKMFYDYKNPGEVFLEAIDVYKKEERKFWASFEDPILVYKTDTPGYYAVIKSWGNDFTPLRRLYGFLTTKRAMTWLIAPAMKWLPAYGILKLVCQQPQRSLRKKSQRGRKYLSPQTVFRCSESQSCPLDLAC